MATQNDRDPSNASTLHLTLESVSLNMPSVIPITRSLSKSNPRDPAIKHPPPPRAQVKDRAEDDISVQPSTQINELEIEHIEDPPILPAEHPKAPSCSPIDQLPHEILDAIISHVGGQLGSAGLSKRSDRVRNWNAILRHPRRKTVSDLALVCPTWRCLVQERIFRHIKIQGTLTALTDLGEFLLSHRHLQQYIRHLQVIVPIWETKKEAAMCQRHAPDLGRIDPTGSVFVTTLGQPITRGVLNDQQAEVSQMFRPASKNATLSEIFATAQFLLPELHALTIEAGHCKRPPQIRYFPAQISRSLPSSSDLPSPTTRFRVPFSPRPSLPDLPFVKVLILKGAWNIIRQAAELNIIHRSLPNIQELHCIYHSPKTDAYITMCTAFCPHNLPSSIKHLNICLEGLYAKNPSSLTKWRKVYPEHHICRTLGSLAPQLESLTYTGRVCGSLFSTALKEAERFRSGTARLSRIDIVVQNICRDINANNDGTGIHNWPFIQGFETLVIQAMRVLAAYSDVNFLRIRFIDLDSPDPLLNPSFHLEGSRAWGFWSEEILRLLYATRPNARFEGAVVEGPFPEVDHFPGVRKSHSIEYYGAIAQGLGRGIL